MTQRRKGPVALAIIYALLGANAWVQVALALVGRSDDPGALVVLQTLVGASGMVAAWGAWAARAWAPIAAGAHAAITAAMLAALPSLLDLPAEARQGIWSGAGLTLAFGAWAAWYLRRVHIFVRHIPPT